MCRVGSSVEGDCLGHFVCTVGCSGEGDWLGHLSRVGTTLPQQQSIRNLLLMVVSLLDEVTPMKPNSSASNWEGASEGGHEGGFLATKPWACYSCGGTHPVVGHKICLGWWSENRFVGQQQWLSQCDNQ